MKISHNWLKSLFNHALSPEEAAALLTSTGLEVEGVERVDAVPGGFEGLVVGEVLTREKHLNADRLSVTTVNIGSETLPIVCGAANVAAGQKVVVATPGAMLYPTEGEPFQIKKGKIRGEESHGMICAEDEIGVGTSHEGIMVLSADAVPGTPVAAYFNAEPDFCLEIGLTPNRTDAMSHFGVARDLRAAMLFRENASFPSIPPLQAIPVDAFEEGAEAAPVVSVVATEACNRYAAVTVRGVTVAPSPDWLLRRLKTIGVKPINNIVDITNLVLHEIGQPLHAFDAAKISGGKIVVRKADEGEKFITLDGVERSLSAEDLMICDEQKPMCMAGVFGGIYSGISDSTTDVVIESAVFDTVSIRKSAKRHLLHTDASYRFERGVDPEMTLYALKRAALLMAEIAGGTIASKVSDTYPTPLTKAQIELDLTKLNTFIGKNIPQPTVEALLKELDFSVVASEGKLNVEAPLYRRDVTRQADVAEEILRIVGYDTVEIPSRVHASMSFKPQPDPENVYQRVADMFTARGWNEAMSNSLTKTAYSTLFEQEDLAEKSAVRILNPLSSDLGQLRQSLLFQALEMTERNINFRNTDIRSYEFGRVYHTNGERIRETERLALWISGATRAETWNGPTTTSDFFTLKDGLEQLFTKLQLAHLIEEVPAQHAFFTDALEYKLHGKSIGFAGLVNGSLLRTFDIKQAVVFAELDWAPLVKAHGKQQLVYRELPKFPSVRRDLSLLVESGVSFKAIREVSLKTEKGILKDVGLFDVYEGKNLDAGKKSYAVSFILQDESGTLTDKRIEKTMERIQQALESELGARLRS